MRRDRDRAGLSIRVLAERHGVHRRAVRVPQNDAAGVTAEVPIDAAGVTAEVD